MCFLGKKEKEASEDNVTDVLKIKKKHLKLKTFTF